MSARKSERRANRRDARKPLKMDRSDQSVAFIARRGRFGNSKEIRHGLQR
jgi:hypothetical protein